MYIRRYSQQTTIKTVALRGVTVVSTILKIASSQRQRYLNKYSWNELIFCIMILNKQPHKLLRGFRVLCNRSMLTTQHFILIWKTLNLQISTITLTCTSCSVYIATRIKYHEILNVPRCSNANAMFVSNNISTFECLIRRDIFSFLLQE